MTDSSSKNELDVEDLRRYRYGREHSLSPLATNNPNAFCMEYTTWDPKKAVFPISCPSLHDERQIYDAQIHPAILHILDDGPTQNLSNLEAIHPVRLGFVVPETRDEPVITLLLVFKKGSVGQTAAKELLSRLEKQITAICSSNNVEQFFIDICEPGGFGGDCRSTLDSGSSPWVNDYAQTIKEKYPSIGASIAPEGSTLTGSLGFYLYHGEDVYAVTNCHVVGCQEQQSTTDTEGPIPAYRYREGEKMIMVESPSPTDRKSIREILVDEVEELQVDVQKMEEERLVYKERGEGFWPQKKEENLRCYRQILQQKRDRSTQFEEGSHVLGHLHATSGLTPPPANKGRMDWAIIKVNQDIKSLCENKYRSIQNSAQKYSTTVVGLQNIRNHMKDRKEAKRQTENAARHFDAGQNEIFLLPTNSTFSPETDELFLKPPSARSSFRHAIYNGIRHTIRHSSCGLTREHVFINPTSTSVGVSEDGDSGSCILSMRDFSAVGMLWGGIQDKVGLETRDVTYVTPLLELIEDIENSMGWVKGSSHL